MPGRRRGAILLLTLFTLLALGLAIHGLLEVLPVYQRAAGRQLQAYQGSLAADAGIHAALRRIEFNLEHGVAQPAVESLEPPVANLLGAYGYRVTIRPDAPTLAGNSTRIYALTSVGLFEGLPLRQVEATVTTQSFAKWVWFHDTRPSDLYLPLSSWTFDGPLHFNSPIRVRDAGPALYAGSRIPFLANATSAGRIEQVPGEAGVPSWAARGDGVKYTESGQSMTTSSVPYDPSTGAEVEDRYRRLYRGGREALRTAVAPVFMPTGFHQIREAAWASSAPLPSQPGVYVNTVPGTSDPAGGLLIAGSASEVELHCQNSNSGVRVRQGSRDFDWVHVTDQAETVVATNSTGGVVASYLVSPGQSYLRSRPVTGTSNISVTVFDGAGNGVVFCTGNISSLYGVNKLRRTIAVDLENRRELTLTDDVTRADTPLNPEAVPLDVDAIRPAGGRDVLGLVAWKVNVSSAREGRSDANPLYLYATVYAGHQKDPTDSRWDSNDELGGFFDDYSGGATGTLHLFGGLQMAWKNSTSYSLQLHFDPLLATNPPPYYPSFNRCRILSWRELPAPR